MTYPATLNPEQLFEIENILKDLQTLKPTHSLRVKDAPLKIKKIRYLIYSWLYNQNIKKEYKIQTYHDTLLITRKYNLSTLPETSIDLNEDIESFIIENLLNIPLEDEYKAKNLIQASLHPENHHQTLDLWRKLQEGTQT